MTGSGGRRGYALVLVVILVAVIGVVVSANLAGLVKETRRGRQAFFALTAHQAALSGIELAIHDMDLEKRGSTEPFEIEYGRPFFPDVHGHQVNCRVEARPHGEGLLLTARARVTGPEKPGLERSTVAENQVRRAIKRSAATGPWLTDWQVSD